MTLIGSILHIQHISFCRNLFRNLSILGLYLGWCGVIEIKWEDFLTEKKEKKRKKEKEEEEEEKKRGWELVN